MCVCDVKKWLVLQRIITDSAALHSFLPQLEFSLLVLQLHVDWTFSSNPTYKLLGSHFHQSDKLIVQCTKQQTHKVRDY